jgi:hypothetical protein
MVSESRCHFPYAPLPGYSRAIDATCVWLIIDTFTLIRINITPFHISDSMTQRSIVFGLPISAVLPIFSCLTCPEWRLAVLLTPSKVRKLSQHPNSAKLRNTKQVLLLALSNDVELSTVANVFLEHWSSVAQSPVTPRPMLPIFVVCDGTERALPVQVLCKRAHSIQGDVVDYCTCICHVRRLINHPSRTGFF